MNISLRAALAALASVAVLAFSAVAGAGAAPAPQPGPMEDGGGGLAAGICHVDNPDCEDTIVDPDGGQSGPGNGAPGSSGGGAVALPPDDGSVVHDIPCGVLVEGNDGTVSYEMCPDDPGLEPEPVPGLEPEPVPGLEPEPVPEPTIVKPTPGMAGVHPVSFAGGGAYVSPDDSRVIVVDYWSGIEPCYVLDHIEVVETGDSVTITLLEGSDPAAGDAVCIEIGVFKRALITLDEPLGDRRIVDGAA